MLASFKADQRPYRSSAANPMGAAVLAHVARSGRLDATHRWTKPKSKKIMHLVICLQISRGCTQIIPIYLYLHWKKAMAWTWMLKYDCFETYRHVKYYFGYEILIIFYSKFLNHNFSFLTAIDINLMLFEVETNFLISPRIVPYAFLLVFI